MREQPKPLPKPMGGMYYTIVNCMNGLALSMPKSNRYYKDKPQFQQLDPNNINQLWMIQQIVHAISTLVIQCVLSSNICKLEFGKQKYSQLFYLEEGLDLEKYKLQQNNQRKGQGIKYEPPLPHIVNQTLQEQKSLKRKSQIKYSSSTTNHKPGQRYVAKIRIRQREKSRKYLFCDRVTKTFNVSSIREQKNEDNCKKQKQESKVNSLKCMEIDLATQAQSSLWEIRQVFIQENQILSRTCYIASMRSGQVIDVPQASDKQGVQIIQYPCNFKFNQKWILKKVDQLNGYGYYFIINAKNGLYLDIKGQSTKQGSPIIQWENHEGKNQIWRLQEQGKRVYLIRSALDKELLLGVRQNSLKQGAQLVTRKIETDCFWVIHGYIPS